MKPAPDRIAVNHGPDWKGGFKQYQLRVAALMAALEVVEPECRCNWCKAPATTWFRDLMSCDRCEPWLQRVANVETNK